MSRAFLRRRNSLGPKSKSNSNYSILAHYCRQQAAKAGHLLTSQRIPEFQIRGNQKELIVHHSGWLQSRNKHIQLVAWSGEKMRGLRGQRLETSAKKHARWVSGIIRGQGLSLAGEPGEVGR